MKAVLCPACGARMEKNGFTTAGKQRWRCANRGGSQTVKYDTAPARLEEFLSWLLPKSTQLEMPGQGGSFRRRASESWTVWPMPAATGEIHRVIYVDEIYLARDLMVLIASSDDYVLSWYMAQSEASRAWEALLETIPAPQTAVADGGTGTETAVPGIGVSFAQQPRNLASGNHGVSIRSLRSIEASAAQVAETLVSLSSALDQGAGKAE